MAQKMKEELLKLLETDVEFRYAVAGCLGLLEVLKKLDKMGEEQMKLAEEQARLREDFNKMLKLIGAMEARLDRVEKTMEARLDRVEKTMEARLDRVEIRLGRVERTLEKLTLDIEEEARSIVRHRLGGIGLKVQIEPLILPDLELNIYGVFEDFCVIGEASVRAGLGLLDGLKRKLSLLKAKYPDKLRGRVIQVIYTSLALPELVERARDEGVWVLKATEDIVELKIT